MDKSDPKFSLTAGKVGVVTETTGPITQYINRDYSTRELRGVKRVLNFLYEDLQDGFEVTEDDGYEQVLKKIDGVICSDGQAGVQNFIDALCNSIEETKEFREYLGEYVAVISKMVAQVLVFYANNRVADIQSLDASGQSPVAMQFRWLLDFTLYFSSKDGALPTIKFILDDREVMKRQALIDSNSPVVGLKGNVDINTSMADAHAIAFNEENVLPVGPDSNDKLGQIAKDIIACLGGEANVSEENLKRIAPIFVILTGSENAESYLSEKSLEGMVEGANRLIGIERKNGKSPFAWVNSEGVLSELAARLNQLGLDLPFVRWVTSSDEKIITLEIKAKLAKLIALLKKHTNNDQL